MQFSNFLAFAVLLGASVQSAAIAREAKSPAPAGGHAGTAGANTNNAIPGKQRAQAPTGKANGGASKANARPPNPKTSGNPAGKLKKPASSGMCWEECSPKKPCDPGLGCWCDPQFWQCRD